jgi:hypothetical protein
MERLILFVYQNRAFFHFSIAGNLLRIAYCPKIMRTRAPSSLTHQMGGCRYE